jgi:O-methyltransferase
MDPGEIAYLELLKKVLTASVYDESAWAVVEPGRLTSPLRPLRFARDLLRRMFVATLRRRSLLLVRRNPFSPEGRAEGRDWPMFGYTMVGHKRLDNVQDCVETVLREGVRGDFIETGAWRGGTAIFMRALLKAHGVRDRKVWVADSFEGLPVPASREDGHDLSRVDHLKVSLEQVRANFARFGLLDGQVEFLKGWFKDTLPGAPVERLAILRLDGDLHSSTMDALRALHHKVQKGGFVIVDDYYSWESCRRAVTEFLAEKNLKPEIRPIDWTGAFWRV